MGFAPTARTGRARARERGAFLLIGHTRAMLPRKLVVIALTLQLLAALAALAATRGGADAASTIAGGINVEPSIRPTVYAGANPDSWWCSPPDCYRSADPKQTIDQELAVAARLRVADVRIEFPWALMQPQARAFEWSRADLIVAEARAYHVTLQPVLMWTPAWENPDISQVTSGGDFAAFVAAFTKRYAHTFPVIEMWNEPDGGAYGAYTGGREKVYVDTILNPGYGAVKSADPATKVELGGPINDSGGCCPFLRAVIADGGDFDIAAFHNYIGAGSAIAESQAYRDMLDRNGRGSVAIWMGEYGVQDANANDVTQVQLMESILGGGNNLAMAQWYNLRDDFAMSCCPPTVAVAAHWGLLQHDDCTAKAGFATMAALLGGEPGQPSCAGVGVSPSGRPPGAKGGTGRVASGTRSPSVPPPLVLAGCAVLLASGLLLFLRHRVRARRRGGDERADGRW